MSCGSALYPLAGSAGGLVALRVFAIAREEQRHSC
jgi:hypothetical protein